MKSNFFKIEDPINIKIGAELMGDAMLNRVFKFFLLPLALFALIGATGNFQLKKTDVRVAMDEMLDYHVEYKTFSPLLARRTLKIYLQQFDPEKMYLLSSEAKNHLDVKEDKISATVQKYAKDDLSDYAAMNQTIQSAITRARGYRLEMERELIKSDDMPQPVLVDSYVDYAATEKELKQRIRNQLLTILSVEKRNGTLRSWNPQQRQKII